MELPYNLAFAIEMANSLCSTVAKLSETVSKQYETILLLRNRIQELEGKVQPE